MVLLVPVATKSTSFDEQVVERKSQLTSRSKITTCTKRYQTKTQHQRFTSSKRIRQHHDCLDLTPSTMVPSSGRTTCLNDEEYCSTFNREDITKRRRRIRGTYKSSRPLLDLMVCFGMLSLVLLVQRFVSEVVVVEAISPNPVGSYAAVSYWTNDGNDGSNYTRQVNDVWSRMVGTADNPVEESVLGYPIIFHDYAKDEFPIPPPEVVLPPPPDEVSPPPPTLPPATPPTLPPEVAPTLPPEGSPTLPPEVSPTLPPEVAPTLPPVDAPTLPPDTEDEDEPEPQPGVTVPPDQPEPEPVPEGVPGEAEISNPDNFIFDGPEDAFPSLNNEGPLLSVPEGIPPELLGGNSGGGRRRLERERRLQEGSQANGEGLLAQYEYVKFDSKTGDMIPSGVAVIKGIDPPRGMFPKHVMPIPIPTGPGNQQPQIITNTTTNSTEVDREESDVDTGLGDAVTGSGGGTTLTSSLPVTSSTTPLYLAPPLEIAVTGGSTGGDTRRQRMLEKLRRNMMYYEEDDVRAPTNKARTSAYAELETQADELINAPIPVGGDTSIPPPSTTKNNNDGKFPLLVVPMLFANHQYPATVAEGIPDHIAAAYGRSDSPNDRWVPTQSQLNTLFNGKSNGDNNEIDVGTGSLRSFMEQLSHGNVLLEAQVLDWIPLRYNESHYASRQRGYGTKSKIDEAIVEALDYLDMDYHLDNPDVKDPINLKQYDLDNDGILDPGHILFLHSGYGAECGGIAEDRAYYMDRIWSHTSLLLKSPRQQVSKEERIYIRGDTGAGWTSTPQLNKETGVYDVESVVRIPCYSIVSAAHGIHFFRKPLEERIVRVGVLAHELISQMLLGLMEQQDVVGQDSSSSSGVDVATFTRSNAGNWDFTSLGGEGAWGFGAGDQTCVSPLNPLTRIHLGWLQPQQVREITFDDVNTARSSYYDEIVPLEISTNGTSIPSSFNTYDDSDGYRITLKPTTLKNAVVYKVSDGLADGEYLLLEYRRRRGPDDVYSHDCVGSSCGDELVQDKEGGASEDYIDGMGLDGCLPIIGGLAIWHVMETEGPQGGGRNVTVRLLQSDQSRDLERGFNTGDSGDLFTPHAMGINDEGATHLFIAPTGKVLTFQNEMVDGQLQVVEDPMAPSKFMTEMGIALDVMDTNKNSNSQSPAVVETNGEFNTTGDEIIMDFDENTNNIIEPTVVGVWIRNIAYQGPKQEEMTFQIKFESFEDGGGLDYIDGDGDGIYHEGNVTDVFSDKPAPSPTLTTTGGGSSPTNSPTLHPTEAPAPSRPPRTSAPVPIPTPSIKRACSPDDKDMALFQVLVTTDLKGEDTWWELNDMKRGPTLWHMEGPYDTGISKQYNFQACLPKRTCWSWTIHDKSGDGLNKGDGGFYRLTWDGQLLDRSTNTIDGRSPEFYEYGVDFGDGCMNEISNWFTDERYKPEVPMNLIGDMRASGIMFNIHSPMDWPNREDAGQSFMVLHFRKIHLAEVVPGANENRKISLNIYTKNGSYEGYETNKSAWVLCQTLNNISPMGFQQWTHTVDGGFNQSRSNRGLGGIMIAKGTTQAFYIEVFDPVPPDAQDKISDTIVPFQRNDVIYVNDCIGRVDMKQKGTPNQIDMRFANKIDVYSGTMVLPNFGGISQATKKSSNGDSTACVEVLFKLNQMTVLQPNENGEYPLVGEDRIDGASESPDWMLARDEYYQYDEALYYNQVPPTAFDPSSYGIMDGTSMMNGDEGSSSFMMETAQDSMMPGGSGLDISRGAGADFNFVQQDENELLLSSSAAAAAAAKAKDSPDYFGLVVANGLNAKLIATSGQMIEFDQVPLPINKNNVPPVFHSNPSGGTCIPLYNITKLEEHTNERRHKEGAGVVGQTPPPPQGRESSSSSSQPPYYYDEVVEHTTDDGSSFLSGDDFLIGWAYVSNSESEHLDDNTKGGVGTLIFDLNGNLVDYNMMLQGTNNNAGGGMTPWGTWLSCEEDGNVGFVYEVDVQQMAAPRLLHHLNNQEKKHQGVNEEEEYFSGRETFEVLTDFDDRMEEEDEMTMSGSTTTSTTCLGQGGGNFHSVAYDARSFNALACTTDGEDDVETNCHVDFYVSVDTEWSVIRKYTPHPQLIRDSYLNGGSTLNILSKDPNQSFEDSCTHKRNGPLLYIEIISSSDVSTQQHNTTTGDDDDDDDEDVLAKGTFQWTESRQEAQLSWSTLEFPFTEQILIQDGNLYVRSKVVPNTMLIFDLDDLTWIKQPLSNVLDSIYQYQVYSNEQANRGPFLSSKWRSWHHWQPNEALDGLATTSTELTTSSSSSGQSQIAVHDLMFYTQDGSYDSSKTKEKEEEDDSSMKLPGVYARDETIGGILLPLMVVKKNSMYYNYFCGTGTATDVSSPCRGTMKLSGLALSPDQTHLYVAFQHPGHVWEITREDGQTFKGQVLDMSTRSGSFDVAALPMNYARENSSPVTGADGISTPNNSGNSTSTVTSGPSSSSSQQYHHRRRRDMRRHLLAGDRGSSLRTTTSVRM